MENKRVTGWRLRGWSRVRERELLWHSLER